MVSRFIAAEDEVEGFDFEGSLVQGTMKFYRSRSVLNRAAVERLWQTYMGSRHQFWRDELERLQQLKDSRQLTWTELMSLYYTTKFWTWFKQRFEKTTEKKCKECGSRLQVHLDHKNYPGFGAETFDDVQWLCLDCHDGKSKFDLRAWKQKSPILAITSDDIQLFEIFRGVR
jgi:hypothetical protein